MESFAGTEGKTYTVSYKLRVFDEDALEQAMEDLQDADVFAAGESWHDNSVEQNLEILVLHLDVLARYRESETYDLLSCGVEILGS
ncbi:MAG: hypothetical protein AB7L09_02075 [Nitrospira sp.]